MGTGNSSARTGLVVLLLVIALITFQNAIYFARGYFLHLAPMLCVCGMAWAMLRDSGPPKPSTVFWGLMASGAAGVVLELAFGIYKHMPFDENGVVTLLSVTQLLLTSLLTCTIWRLRRPPGRLQPKDKSSIWGIIALGFAYLATDELALFHEGLDRLMHKVLQIKETAWTSRADDVLVGLYGVAGLLVLRFFITEIRRFPLCYKLLKVGFAALFLSVLCDISSSRSDFFVWLLGQDWGLPVHALMEDLEEILKLVSEIFFITGFSSALGETRAEAVPRPA